MLLLILCSASGIICNVQNTRCLCCVSLKIYCEIVKMYCVDLGERKYMFVGRRDDDGNGRGPPTTQWSVAAYTQDMVRECFVVVDYIARVYSQWIATNIYCNENIVAGIIHSYKMIILSSGCLTRSIVKI